DLVAVLGEESDVVYSFIAAESLDQATLEGLEEAIRAAGRAGARLHVLVVDENATNAGPLVSKLSEYYCPLGLKVGVAGPLDNEATIAAFIGYGERVTLATGYTGVLSPPMDVSTFILPEYPERLDGPGGSYLEVFGYALSNNTLGGAWIPIAVKCYNPGIGYMTVIADSTVFVNAIVGDESYRPRVSRLLDYVLPPPGGTLVVFDLSLYIDERYKSLAQVHPSTIVVLASRLYYEAERLGIELLSGSTLLSPLLLALTLATATLMLSMVMGESRRGPGRGRPKTARIGLACEAVESALERYGYTMRSLWKSTRASRAMGGEDYLELSRAAGRAIILCRLEEQLGPIADRVPPLRALLYPIRRLRERELLKISVLAGIMGDVMTRSDYPPGSQPGHGW
ncbi:MAG: hypothetical protein LRS43_03010, partial [Desulfurococcales archaeon]|nr:hypothetical protein [Desulfurococcales archaeon]